MFSANTNLFFRLVFVWMKNVQSKSKGSVFRCLFCCFDKMFFFIVRPIAKNLEYNKICRFSTNRRES
jgi:hypothetical protein